MKNMSLISSGSEEPSPVSRRATLEVLESRRLMSATLHVAGESVTDTTEEPVVMSLNAAPAAHVEQSIIGVLRPVSAISASTGTAIGQVRQDIIAI